MGKVNHLLSMRLKTKDSPNEKMSALAKRSNTGELSSFSGVFRVSKLTDQETESLVAILKNHQSKSDQNIDADLEKLMTLTSEVKAITNQAVILHGERIKKAQKLLKTYRDGAFTAWLVATYGNRQTPYNFLQYYEFYSQTPTTLHPKIDEMPRQAVYTLASRPGSQEQKEKIVKEYNGEPKQELLTIIRSAFPLEEGDKRMANLPNQSIAQLQRLQDVFQQPQFVASSTQKKEIKSLLSKLRNALETKTI